MSRGPGVSRTVSVVKAVGELAEQTASLSSTEPLRALISLVSLFRKLEPILGPLQRTHQKATRPLKRRQLRICQQGLIKACLVRDKLLLNDDRKVNEYLLLILKRRPL